MEKRFNHKTVPYTAEWDSFVKGYLVRNTRNKNVLPAYLSAELIENSLDWEEEKEPEKVWSDEELKAFGDFRAKVLDSPIEEVFKAWLLGSAMDQFAGYLKGYGNKI